MIFRSLYRFLSVCRSSLVIFALCYLCGSAGEQCQKLKSSSCACKAGGFEINLHELIEDPKVQTPLFHDVKGPNGSLFSYNPCEGFDEPKEKPDKCKNVAVCQHTKDNNYFSLGNQGTTVQTSGDPKHGTVVFTYRAKDSDTTRIAEIALNCSHAKKAVFKVIGEQPHPSGATEIKYKFELQTSLACYPKHKISIGSILLIVFFVSVLIYLAGGMLFLRFARGAKGWEQIPNYEFWHEFPLYVRDGVVFTINGCKTETTYEKI